MLLYSGSLYSKILENTRKYKNKYSKIPVNVSECRSTYSEWTGDGQTMFRVFSFYFIFLSFVYLVLLIFLLTFFFYMRIKQKPFFCAGCRVRMEYVFVCFLCCVSCSFLYKVPPLLPYDKCEKLWPCGVFDFLFPRFGSALPIFLPITFLMC